MTPKRNSSRLPDAGVIDPEARIKAIHARVLSSIASEPKLLEHFRKGDFRAQTLLYMLYWFRRLRNNREEQERIRRDLVGYLGETATHPRALTTRLLSDDALVALAQEYVDFLLVPVKTVDLVVMKAGHVEDKDKEVLCITRTYYPLGPALPGGFIWDQDEDNVLGVQPQVFAALRVAGEKVLALPAGTARYAREKSKGKDCFVVRGKSATPCVRLYLEDAGGHRYRENIKSVLRPSDPRHIVDSTAFRCELTGAPKGLVAWRKKSAIMSTDAKAQRFAFGHHREIVAYITAQTSVEKERGMKEREFIREIIRRPQAVHRALRTRFTHAAEPALAAFPELFPVVDRLLSEAFRNDINALCRAHPLLAGIRDKAVISLRHVSLKNRTFCPYLPTLHAIADAIAFFDVAARQKRGFYDAMPKDRIVEHDPGSTPHASYHMYRYKYRLDQFLGMIPDQIAIPTFEELSAEDLMRVRGVPIRFIGLSTDFLYVDEFEQSPEEFFMHDVNHSWRMIMEDRAAEERYGMSPKRMYRESNAFIDAYLGRIRMRAADPEERREMKKLKKIILFEIVHEDARPFLKETIGRFIQGKEGGSVPFEVPRIDAKTGYMDVVDTLDTGISTLSYVRNKLQHGFYDHIDAQLPQIVDPRYRTAEAIAHAAYDMLVELDAKPVPSAELDAKKRVSYEWLLRRACAVGPDNIHGKDKVDPAVKKYGDGAKRLNPKRYQVGQ